MEKELLNKLNETFNLSNNLGSNKFEREECLSFLLYKIIDKFSIDNKYLLYFIDGYCCSNVFKTSKLFSTLFKFSDSELSLFVECANRLKEIDDIGIGMELDYFIKEIRFIKRYELLKKELINNFDSFLYKYEIIKFKDGGYDYSISVLNKREVWLINDNEVNNILDSLEWNGFTDKAKLFFTPRLIIFALDNFYKNNKIDYLFDYLIDFINSGVYLISNFKSLFNEFIYLIDGFHDDLSFDDKNTLENILCFINKS